MVDLSAQAANVARNLRYRPRAALRELASRTWYSFRSASEPDPVLTADWDVLVVLDGCRADVFEAVVSAGGYDHLPADATETRTSPASATDEWLRAVFAGADADRLAGIAYVSGNPYTATEIDASRFHAVEEVWREAWDDDLGTIPPRPITDRAIRTWRSGDADRLVAHYMQPHFPSIASPHGSDDGVELAAWGDPSLSVWDDLRFGRRSEADVRRAYRANLAYVLDELEVLLSNLTADRVVVTADHGNAFGERGVYGHPGGVDLPYLRAVPWCVTTATDTRTREPGETGDEHAGDDPDRQVVEQRLRDLGYRA